MVLLSRKGTQLSSYGTARWAYLAELRQRGMLGGDGSGLIIGQGEGKPSYPEGVKALFNRRLAARDAVTTFLQSGQGQLVPKPRHFVRLTESVHTVVAAPTGFGKGRSCIVPFLVTCPDSCVVIDMKDGENAKKTAKAREDMGHRVVLVDPFNAVTAHPDTYNPMDLISPASPTAIEDCRALAEALVVRTGRETDRFWDDSAEIWLGSMICAMVTFPPPHQRNLQSVRAQLADPLRRAATIEMMCQSPQWQGMLSRFGHTLKNYQGKTRDSVLAATNRHLMWADSIAIADSISQSSFNPADLLKGNMTIFLILKTEHHRTHSALVRLWISSMLRVCIKGGLQNRTNVQFLCDEAFSLGRLEQLSDVLGIGRGYGLRMQLYYQDLGQIRKCWPDGADQTLLANTTQVFFGVNDPITADYISTRIGEKTIVVASGGTGGGETYQTSSQGQGGSSHSTSTNVSDNWSQIGRKLLKPEEVMALHPRTAITFAPGVRPIATTLVRYDEPSFTMPRRKGLFMAAVETACLFITVAILAAAFTMTLYTGAFNVKGSTRVFQRRTETRPRDWGNRGRDGGREGRRVSFPHRGR